MKILRLIGFCLAGFILMSNSFLIAQDDEANGSGYHISVGDLIEISVYDEPDLSKTIRVPPDGIISYPLLGNLPVLGLTARELKEKISELLANDYLVNPQVSVFIRNYGNFSILGQVRSPGSYEMEERLTLTGVIARAGGFTDTADTSKIRVIRDQQDKKETIEVNFDQILNKETEDIEIKSNDTIIVVSCGQISVMGQVRSPGVYNLKKKLGTVEAIALAGGLGEMAASNDVKVIRIENGQKKIFRVPVGSILRDGDKSRDIILKPDDTVVVPESLF